MCLSGRSNGMSRRAALGTLGLTVALGVSCGGGDTGVSDFVGSSNGSACLVPESELVSGGPGRDGIPALTNPVVVSASDGDAFLAPSALVLGVVENGETRAYPHNVLWWHEIVNDELGGIPITVSYCPLTGSGMVYEPRIGGQTLNFGVSGLLFDNNLVLFDRATDSLWSQMRVQSVCGSFSGTVPALKPVVQSRWSAWKAMYPETTVLSFSTGFSRNYDQYPYGAYDQVGNDSLLFPQSNVDRRRAIKELVLGIVEGSAVKAYPYGELGRRSAFNDVVGGRPIVVVYDAEAEMALAFDRRSGGETLTFEIADSGGFPFCIRDLETGSRWSLDGRAVDGPLAGSRVQQVATYSAMWFAWAAFNSNTELFTP
jgi:hypothetical protein